MKGVVLGVLTGVMLSSTAAVVAPPATPTFLPTVSAPPAVVYGTTKLVSAYSGPALRVQRASDDVEQDIAFGSKYFDTDAASAFRGASSLGLRKWYDQSGNGFHQDQATKVNQPGVYAEASYNAAPSISFDSSPLAVGVRSKFTACTTGPVIEKSAFTEFYLLAPSFSFNDNYYGSMPADLTTVSLFTRTTNVGLLGNNTSPYVSTATPKQIPPIHPCVMRWRGGPTGKQFGLNKATFNVATAPAAGTVTGKGLGRWNGTIPSSYDGEFDIIAYVAYNAALSDADCLLVETALMAQCSVLTPALASAKIVFDGDSRTEGSGNTKNQTWPKKVLSSISTPLYATNMGVGGQTLQTMAGAVAARIASQYDAAFTKNIVVMGGAGINDLTANRTDAQLIADFQTYANGIHASQLLVAATIPLRDTSTTAQNNYRIAFNTWLRANWATYAEALVDLDAIPEFATYSTNYWIDIVHFNDAGQTLWATAFKPAILALLG
ncbi:SGNH/GDSL hydrolase family protein [Mesorhizobium sp. LNJC405B00]|uniref:SGNH/GDSL hydrolase family protein n=1 Tax=Mesorhizobium sp. LNJC405B00 TaxID=1287281 RepID=UPI000AB07E88|nr:SGNH/GDSL hydrolase family protein [Mesorhizobium sp. LNJC405B00]